MSENLARQNSTSLSPLKRALAKRFNSGTSDVLLVDCSGSMASHDAEGQRRIDGARKCVDTLRQNKLEFTQIVFSATPELSDIIPEPSGSTDLAAAIYKAAEHRPRRLIIVSDGHPDDEAAALEAMNSLPSGIVIDTFFVGTPPHGEAFLKTLAARHGGTFGATTKLSELAGKIMGALTANAESLTPSRGPIAL